MPDDLLRIILRVASADCHRAAAAGASARELAEHLHELVDLLADQRAGKPLSQLHPVLDQRLRRLSAAAAGTTTTWTPVDAETGQLLLYLGFTALPLLTGPGGAPCP